LSRKRGKHRTFLSNLDREKYDFSKRHTPIAHESVSTVGTLVMGNRIYIPISPSRCVNALILVVGRLDLQPLQERENRHGSLQEFRNFENDEVESERNYRGLMSALTLLALMFSKIARCTNLDAASDP
jgi:hypothetical protein